jgi:tetratricopeptide (TPR) repeat protein
MKKLLLLLLFVPLISFGQTAEEYFDSGFVKAKIADYYGAISDFTIAIELNPNYTNAYYNRGLSKAKLEDYKAAIVDYNKAIELKPNLGIVYNNRAIAKELSGIDGCADARKAKELGYNADELIGMVCN